VQILADELQLSLEQIKHVQGDTARVTAGTGTFASRSLFKAGQIIGECTTMVIGKAKRLAAIRFGVEVERTEYAERPGSCPWNQFRRLPVRTRAMAAGRARPAAGTAWTLSAEVNHRKSEVNFPSGTHVCEVEIDPETGAGQAGQLHRRRRRRTADQPADLGRPDAWRNRARHRPGDVGTDRLRFENPASC